MIVVDCRGCGRAIDGLLAYENHARQCIEWLSDRLCPARPHCHIYRYRTVRTDRSCPTIKLHFENEW